MNTDGRMWKDSLSWKTTLVYTLHYKCFYITFKSNFYACLPGKLKKSNVLLSKPLSKILYSLL